MPNAETTPYKPTPRDWEFLKDELTKLMDEDVTGVIRQIVGLMTIIEAGKGTAGYLIDSD